MSNLYLVKGDIAQLPEKMLEAAWEEIIQAVTLMKALAQVYVRVETGSLRDSIRVERGGEGLNYRVIRLRAGGYITNPKTGKLVNYAAAVEAKYPYMRPAYDQVKGDLAFLISRGVLQRTSGLLTLGVISQALRAAEAVVRGIQRSGEKP